LEGGKTMKEISRKDAKEKKPYVKPQVKQVQLKPEEAVLGNCKTDSSAGALQSQCNSPLTCLVIAS
jgi:hypothetical protein